jgi:hypothetical protein
VLDAVDDGLGPGVDVKLVEYVFEVAFEVLGASGVAI